MDETLSERGERERTRLRAAIAEVSLQVSSFSAGAPIRPSALASSWSELLPLIEPEPELARRPCPHCQRRIMLHATRCMYCLKTSAGPGAKQ
jgi:hypothetical protein